MVRALERFPAHHIEELIVTDAITQLVSDVKGFLALGPGGPKRTQAVAANSNLADDVGRFLIDTPDDGPLSALRRVALRMLMAEAHAAGGETRTMFDWTTDMVFQERAATADIAKFLGLFELDASLVQQHPMRYEWALSLYGVSCDVGKGLGGFAGWMDVTKRRSAAGQILWTQRYRVVSGTYSVGVSYGCNFKFETSNVLDSLSDWSEETFEGGFSIDGVSAGFAPYDDDNADGELDPDVPLEGYTYGPAQISFRGKRRVPGARRRRQRLDQDRRVVPRRRGIDHHRRPVPVVSRPHPALPHARGDGCHAGQAGDGRGGSAGRRALRRQ